MDQSFSSPHSPQVPQVPQTPQPESYSRAEVEFELAKLRNSLLQEHHQVLASALQAQAPAAPPGSSPSSRPGGQSRPRLAAPSAYCGVSSDLDDWVTQWNKQFRFYSTPDTDKVKDASAFLSGAAETWWDGLEDSARPTVWVTFIAELRKRFEIVTAEDTARAALKVLVQGKKSIDDYIATFTRLSNKVKDLTDKTKAWMFMDGLKTDIRQHLKVIGITGYAEAIEAAARVGGALSTPTSRDSNASVSRSSAAPMELDALSCADSDEPANPQADKMNDTVQLLLAAIGRMSPNSNRGSNNSNRGRSYTNNSREGMTANSTNFPSRNLPRINHLSPVQVKDYMDAGKCFQCGDKNHQSRACPNRKTQSGN